MAQWNQKEIVFFDMPEPCYQPESPAHPVASVQTKIQVPSYTAFLVAMARREEDPFGYQLISSLPGYAEAFERKLQYFGLYHGVLLSSRMSLADQHKRLLSKIASPGYDAFYAGRVWFVDQCIRQWLDKNRLRGRQSVVLVLGAGFDSKFIRYAQEPDINVVEFDTHRTQELKRQAIHQVLGQEPESISNLLQFPVDYTDPADARRQLKRALEKIESQLGSTQEVSYFVTMEGLSYYLDKASNRKIFEDLLSVLPKGTRCFVDCYRKSLWDPDYHPYGQFLSFLGEPVRFTTDDYFTQVVQPLEWNGHQYRELLRLCRAEMACERLRQRGEQPEPALAYDAFGRITRFSLLEIE